ncbi:MAG: hypothetical protein ACXVCP_08575 [Bdellovibrio sp.]
MTKTILSVATIAGFSVTAVAEGNNVCTITPMCTYHGQSYYGLYVGTKLVNAINSQNIELDYCVDDTWKASQAVRCLKDQAKKLVADGTCKAIINRTIYK